MTRALSGGVVAFALLALPAPAFALIPSGNLLANPGAEAGAAASNAASSFAIAGWDRKGTKMTAVRYGAPGGFPTTSDAGAIDGGTRFFAGGPANFGSSAQQKIDLSAAAPEIDAGKAQLRLAGCLGGYADQDDSFSLNVKPFKANDMVGLLFPGLIGPKAAERGNATKLVPKTLVRTVPPGVRTLLATMSSSRAAGTYNDGYGDNLSISLEPLGTPATAAHCFLPGSPTQQGGTNAGKVDPVQIGRGRVSGDLVKLVLSCLVHDPPCVGSLSLKKRGGGGRLARARFAIRPGGTRSLRLRIPSRRGVRIGRLRAKVKIRGVARKLELPLRARR